MIREWRNFVESIAQRPSSNASAHRPNVDSDALSDNEYLKRVQLLRVAVDGIHTSSVERTRSIDTKASFSVLAVGVLAAFTFPELISSATCYWGILPVGLMIASIVFSVAALWPTRFWAQGADDAVLHLRDPSKCSDLEAEELLLESVVKETTARDAYNEKRAKWVKWSLGTLLAGVVTMMPILIVNSR